MKLHSLRPARYVWYKPRMTTLIKHSYLGMSENRGHTWRQGEIYLFSGGGSRLINGGEADEGYGVAGAGDKLVLVTGGLWDRTEE